MSFHKINKEDEIFIIEHHETLSCREIADALGNKCAPDNIRYHIQRMGLQPKPIRGRIWTQEEWDKLQKIWMQNEPEDVARILNRSIRAVEAVAAKLRKEGKLGRKPVGNWGRKKRLEQLAQYRAQAQAHA